MTNRYLDARLIKLETQEGSTHLVVIGPDDTEAEALERYGLPINKGETVTFVHTGVPRAPSSEC